MAADENSRLRNELTSVLQRKSALKSALDTTSSELRDQRRSVEGLKMRIEMLASRLEASRLEDGVRELKDLRGQVSDLRNEAVSHLKHMDARSGVAAAALAKAATPAVPAHLLKGGGDLKPSARRRIPPNGQRQTASPQNAKSARGKSQDRLAPVERGNEPSFAAYPSPPQRKMQQDYPYQQHDYPYQQQLPYQQMGMPPMQFSQQYPPHGQYQPMPGHAMQGMPVESGHHGNAEIAWDAPDAYSFEQRDLGVLSPPRGAQHTPPGQRGPVRQGAREPAGVRGVKAAKGGAAPLARRVR